MSTSEPYPLYNALRGTLVFEVNFTGRGNPCQKYLRGRFDDLVKFTFRVNPLQNAFWGTLVSEVNFTASGDPCQKHLWGLLGAEVTCLGSLVMPPPLPPPMPTHNAPLPPPTILPFSLQQGA